MWDLIINLLSLKEKKKQTNKQRERTKFVNDNVVCVYE
jgi:hypothetical protein